MPPTGSERVKAILVEAIETTGSDRQVFLDRACGNDAMLAPRWRVSWPRSTKPANSFSLPLPAPAVSEDPLRERPGAKIGPL